MALSFLFGKQGSPAGVSQVPTMSPEQQNLLNSILSTGQQSMQQGSLQSGYGLLQQLLQGGGEPDFSPYEQAARQGFQEQTLPSIAERFSSMGAQGSSAFPQVLSQAGRGLESDLSQQRVQFGQQAQQTGLQALSQLQGLLGQGMATPTFQNIQTPGQAPSYGLVGELLKALAAGAGGFAGGGFAGAGAGALKSLAGSASSAGGSATGGF